ncbi:MAG TPA: GH92 family glycosyl hydrolase [Jatrophihabitans sp.]|jgi:predicted alpha-1,2-mannosidase
MTPPALPVRWLATIGAFALTAGVLCTPIAVNVAASTPPTGAAASPAASPAAGDLTSLVNPYVGTENFGNTFPGASAPFGMVQVSPDTGGQGGYDYKQSSIYGFSQTHLSGVGCGVVGELPIMPTTGAVSTGVASSYASPYSHDDETATPGYYQVGLSRYGINAELTATDRTGWQRYTFPAGQQQNVLFNTGQANMHVIDSTVHVIGDRTIEGQVHDGGFCAGHDEHTVYFSASFDRPISTFGTWSGTTLRPGTPDASTTGGGNGAWVSFAPGSTSADRTVVVKVGLSYTGVAGARTNLAAETGTGYDFDATRTALQKRWNTNLQLATIDGGTHDRQVAYYTALYHSFLHPNLAGDVDGKYQGFDHAVHTATDYTPRQNFSLWDTYRPQNQLLELLQPNVARDDDLSLLAIGREGGWLPRWALANSETNIMTGDPVTPTLVEAWSKGFLAGHEAEAYALLKKNATSLPPAASQYNGRSGVLYYDKLGYIPSGLTVGTDCPSHGGDNDCAHPASATLEYSAADAALSLMADGLGHRTDATMFAQRGRWYRNLWDARIGQFRPRNQDGTWLAPFDPVSGNQQFHESGAYQYQWLVPQDPAGLTSLMGGKAAAQQRLDTFFAYDHLLTDPAGTARTEWISSPYDYYTKPTYNPNNEPDLLAPYMYLWAGAPAKTATVVRAAMTLFTTGPDGMTGNDDLGAMSAWYVFSSLGLYPTMSGSNFFAVSSPQFPSATVQIGAAQTGEHGPTQGGTLHITAPGVSDTNRYITAAKVNGRASSHSWVSWDDIRRGGSLAYTVSANASSWATGAKDVPPSIDATADDHRVALSAAVAPATAVAATGTRSVTITESVVGQWPGSKRVVSEAQAPAGWAANVTQRIASVQSDGLPTGIDFPIRVSIPADAAAGSYPVTVTIKAAGAKTVTRSVSVQLKDVRCALASASQCALDLTSDADLDGTATTTAPASGNFDGGGWSYDAALLPSSGSDTIGGINYSMPDATGVTKNFLTARGQQLALPAGTYSALHVIGAAHGGDVTAQATITYTDGTTAQSALNLTDWAAGSGRNGDTVALAMDHRIKAGQGVDGPPVQLFATSLALDPNRNVQSITLPNNANAEIYAATLAS